MTTKVAIIRRNGFGDLLCTYPLILYIQKQFPDSHITLFVDTSNAPLIPYLPEVDEVVILKKSGNKYWNLLKTAWRYRKQKFDLAISAKTSPMKLINCFLFVLGAKKRIAYVDHAWHSQLINAPLAYDKEKASQAHQALKTLQMIAPRTEQIPSHLYPTAKVSEKSRKQYAPKLLPKVPTILLTFSINDDQRRFDSERTAKLVNQLNEIHPLQVLLVGLEKDAHLATVLKQHLVVPYQAHFPRNFEEFMVWLDAADLFFVGDGGVAHIGAALGKPEVVLFGNVSPTLWAPLGNAVTTLYDSVHVNHLSDEKIFEALNHRLNKVVESERNCGSVM